MNKFCKFPAGAPLLGNVQNFLLSAMCSLLVCTCMCVRGCFFFFFFFFFFFNIFFRNTIKAPDSVDLVMA